MSNSIRKHFSNFTSKDKTRTPTKIECFLEGISFANKKEYVDLLQDLCFKNQQQLKDAEKVILTCDSIFESGIDKQKAINEYIDKYNIPKIV